MSEQTSAVATGSGVSGEAPVAPGDAVTADAAERFGFNPEAGIAAAAAAESAEIRNLLEEEDQAQSGGCCGGGCCGGS